MAYLRGKTSKGAEGCILLRPQSATSASNQKMPSYKSGGIHGIFGVHLAPSPAILRISLQWRELSEDGNTKFSSRKKPWAAAAIL